MATKCVAEKTRLAVVEAYESGLGAYQVAEQLGLHFGTVYAALQLSGIEPDTRGYKPYVPVEPVLRDLAFDPVWAAEFRGFFYGEGCACLKHDVSKDLYNASLVIRLRRDDCTVLKQIQAVLGGRLSDLKTYGFGNPSTQWALTGWANVKAVIAATNLAHGSLMAKKRKDILLLYQACLTRYQMPYYLGDDNRARLNEFHKAIMEVRRFQL